MVPALALTVWGLLTARTLNLFEQGTVVSGGAAFVHGDMLYSEHFAFYGPLAYLVPYTWVALFGVVRGLFLMDTVTGMAMWVVVYALARHISQRPWLAIAAPAVVVLSGGGTQRNLMALVSMLALLQLGRSGRVAWSAAAGTSAALALLWFQDTGVWVAVATALGVVIAHVASRRAEPLPWASVRWWLAGWGAVIVPWVAYLAVRGALRDWVYYCFIFPNSVYTERSATGYLRGEIASWHDLSLPVVAYKYFFYVAPYLCVGLLAAAALWRALADARRAPAPSDRATAWATVSLALLAVFQLRLVAASLDEPKLADCIAPTLAIGIAYAVRGTRSVPTAILLRALMAMLMLMGLQRTARDVVHAPEAQDVSGVRSAELRGASIGGANPPSVDVSEVDDVITFVQQRTRPGEPVFVAPTQPMLYALVARPNATGYDYLDPTYTTPEVDERMRDELASARPGVVVLADNTFPGSDTPGDALAPLTYSWIEDNYRVTGETEHFTFYEPVTP
jgi:hypothetical protein